MIEQVFNQEAELAILNIVLNKPDTIYTIQSVRPFMFSSTPNQLIFATMLELASQNFVIDPSLLTTNVKSKGKLAEIGGVEYVTHLSKLQYNSSNLKEFERQLINNYKTKVLLSTANDIQSKIHSGEEVGNVIGSIRQQIDLLETNSGGEQVVDFLTAGQDMWTDLVRRVENPGLRGVTTGFPDIDLVTGGYNKGDLWIIAGRPGMGKTTDLCNSVLAISKAGQPALIFSLEMNKGQLVERMVSIESGVPLMDIRQGALSKDQLEKISETLKKLKSLPIYIDTNFATDVDYYAATTRKYSSLKGIRVTFLDYVQLAAERGNNQTAELGVFSRTAKLLANQLDITTVMFSQLNRAVELRDDKHPVLSDLRQSGNLEEDADMVMFLYRDEYYNKEKSKYKGMLEKILSKHRNGPTGSFYFKFDSNTLSINDGGNVYK